MAFPRQPFPAGFAAAPQPALYGFNPNELPPAGFFEQSGQADERRQKRLARNRESARQSRRRKKQYLELLEEKVTLLSDEIDALRRQHLGASEHALQELREQRVATLSVLGHEAGQGQSSHAAAPSAGSHPGPAAGTPPSASADARAFTALDELSQRFGANCEERRAVSAYQFEQLWALLLPPHMRFLIWMMIQPAEFFQKGRSAGNALRAAKPPPAGAGITSTTAAASTAPNSTVAAAAAAAAKTSLGAAMDGSLQNLGHDAALDGTGSVLVGTNGGANSELWPLLCCELGLTHEQEEKVRQVQHRLRENKEAWAEQRVLAQLTHHLERLQHAMRSTCFRCHQRTELLRRVLTPVQMARYLAWASAHRATLACSQLEEASIATALHQAQAQAAGGTDRPGGSSELVMMLLRKPSEELTMDEVTFLLDRVSSVRVFESAMKMEEIQKRGAAQGDDPRSLGRDPEVLAAN